MMRILYPIFAIFLSLNLTACGAGSTAGDLSINDLSISDPDETGSVPNDPNDEPNTGPTTAVVTLSWTPPTLNTDMTELNNLASYNIYYGTSADKLSLLKELKIDPDIYVTDHLIEYDERLQTGTKYYFGITAVSNSKIESAMSNIVSKDL